MLLNSQQNVVKCGTRIVEHETREKLKQARTVLESITALSIFRDMAIERRLAYLNKVLHDIERRPFS